MAMQYPSLLHSYCIGTNTEITLLLFWGSSAVTMEYLHNYSVELPVWVLQGTVELLQKSSKGTSLYTSAVNVQ